MSITKVGEQVFYIDCYDDLIEDIENWFDTQNFERDKDYRLEDSHHPITPSTVRMIWEDIESANIFEDHFKSHGRGFRLIEENKYFIGDPNTKLFPW